MKFHDVLISGVSFNLPSCTGIIELARERKMLVGDEWLTWSDEAVGFGSRIHKLIAFILQGAIIEHKEWYEFEEPARQCLRAFSRWWAATGFKPRPGFTECELYSVELGVVGHPDTIGTILQHVEIIDWTTGDINTGKLLQLGFYYLAYKEMYPRRTICGARAVHLDKATGDFHQTILLEHELQGYGADFVEIRKAIGVI